MSIKSLTKPEDILVPLSSVIYSKDIFLTIDFPL